ncbi:MAG: saccharopine dehydrogenase family protein, partial [Desulfuromonadales bacterium]|nr:saccharopine dehydrogenase family protein [Desulfuromonadales bacterium]
PCRHWENGRFIETPPLSTKRTFNFPEGIGEMNIYRLYHEEMESLVKNIPTIKKAQFWMTFSDNYLKHLEVLQNVGMTRIDEVEYNGQKIVPIQFLKALLPDPSSLGPLTKGRTCIGVIARGQKNGKPHQVYIYNICDHEAAYKEVKSQAISYTTGVPAVTGAIMMLTGKWYKPGVWNMEQFDPEPFLEELGPMGLPTVVVDGRDWEKL